MPRKTAKARITAALKGNFQEPQLAELAAHFFHAAGGMEKMAKLLYQEFLGAKEGGLMRQRILNMVLMAVKFANERNPGHDDLGLLSEEDLEREGAKVFENFLSLSGENNADA